MKGVLLGMWPSAALALLVGIPLTVLIPFTGGATWPAWAGLIAMEAGLVTWIVVGLRADLRARRRL